MRNLYLLAILALCFGCEQSETMMDELSSQADKQEEIKTRSSGLSASMDESGLYVSWSSPFDCSNPVTILSVSNLGGGGSAVYYPFSSSGSYTFSEFKTKGTYLLTASCGCGYHSLTETYFFSPNGETIVNPQDKCAHNFSNFATYMPNELYLSNGSGSVVLRFWFSSEFVLGLRALAYNESTGSNPGGETRYRIRPTVMSSYSELEFMLPSNSNEFHKYWEVRIYSTACFLDNSTNFKRNSCNNYLTFTFGYDPVVGEWGPTYDNPLRINFTEVKQK